MRLDDNRRVAKRNKFGAIRVGDIVFNTWKDNPTYWPRQEYLVRQHFGKTLCLI
ncbi:hypothetical protein LCGC14_2684790, partial [marine sediment metagenome]